MFKFLKVSLVLLLLAAFTPAQAQFRSLMRTADKQYELNAYNLAVESYKQALARRPTDVEALSRIANSYRMLNQIQTAHTYYQQAVRERKVSKETILEHAHVLKSLGRYEEAKQWYLLYARDYDQVVGNHFAQSADFALRQTGQDAGFVVQVAAVNSPLMDFGPHTPTSNQLVFNSARTGGAFNGAAGNRPFVAAIGPDGRAQEALELRTGYRSESGYVGPVSYSPDGRQVIFTRNNFTPGTRMIPEAGITLNLLIADVNAEGGWTNARPLPFNGTDYGTGFGTFSQDGNTIYFASNRPEGYGGYDIYRARRQGQTWETVPENLGTVVNSVGNELTPYFDGASLFFSSNWHHGLGAYDVFRAEMAADRPSRLYHMGDGVNSVRDDLGFTYDPVSQKGYVVSNRIGGNGQEDVYTVGRATSNLQLLVQSAQTGQPISNASVDFTTCGGQAYATDANGRYVFQSLQGVNCDIVISANGFQPVSLPLQGMQADATNTVRVSLNPGGGGFSGGSSTSIPNGVTPGGSVPPGTIRGYVSNAQDGYPVMDAQVILTKRTTGQRAVLRTNQDGAYFVSLDPFTTYDVAVEASGFEPLTFPVTTNDVVSPDILGNVSLLTSGGYPSTGGGDGQASGQVGGGAPVQGFAVQLGSFNKQPDLSKFSNAQSVGRVYDVNTGGAYKVRVGVFPTRAEAEAAAARLKNNGYGSAFIVADNGTGATGTTTAPGPPPTTPNQPTYTSGGRYKVQLGAYGKPENFPMSRAQQLGSVIRTSRGALTIFMVDSLNSLSQAQNVRTQAQNSGFDGAFILEDVNGTLTKVN